MARRGSYKRFLIALFHVNPVPTQALNRVVKAGISQSWQTHQRSCRYVLANRDSTYTRSRVYRKFGLNFILISLFESLNCILVTRSLWNDGVPDSSTPI